MNKIVQIGHMCQHVVRDDEVGSTVTIDHFVRRLFTEEIHQSGYAALLATLAIFAAGSIPKHGISRSTKFRSR